MYLADHFAGDLIAASYEILMQQREGDPTLQSRYMSGEYHEQAEADIAAAQSADQLPEYLLAAWRHLTASPVPMEEYCGACADMLQREGHTMAPGMDMHAKPCALCGTRQHGARLALAASNRI